MATVQCGTSSIGVRPLIEYCISSSLALLLSARTAIGTTSPDIFSIERTHCTGPIDQLECFSTRQKHHAKTYVTGLVAGRNKTMQGISNHVLPAKSERALNKFLTEYDWDEERLNKERLGFLQQANDTRWSSEGVVDDDDTFTHKTGEHIPNAGKFYDHTVPGYIWGQNLIYALYADEKTTYPLGFRLYEKDAQRRVELAIEFVDELIERGAPAGHCLVQRGRGARRSQRELLVKLTDLLRETLNVDSQDVWANERTPTPVRVFGGRLHSRGLSVREVVADLLMLAYSLLKTGAASSAL